MRDNVINDTRPYKQCSRDILIDKALKNGYNPYQRSTELKDVTKAKYPSVQTNKNNKSKPLMNTRKPAVRCVSPTKKPIKSSSHREIVTLDNFEIVKRKTSTMPFSKIVSVIAVFMIFATVVYVSSLVNQEARRGDELANSLEILNKENKELQQQLAEKVSLSLIEDIAKNDLGMIKISEAEQRYISLKGEDSIKVYDPDSNTPFVLNLLNAFSNMVLSALEYLD